MGKKTTKSWDKKQERRLRSYLKANGYLYICSKGSHAIVENLHLQQTRKLSDDEQKLEVIRKFA